MRKLYQRLALVLGVSTILTVLIFTVSLYERSRTENSNYLSQLLDGVEENLLHASEDYRARLDLLEKDYLNRAWAVEYILSDDPWLVTEEELDILKDLMEVRGISVIILPLIIVFQNDLGNHPAQFADIGKNFLFQHLERYQVFFYNRFHHTVSFTCFVRN